MRMSANLPGWLRIACVAAIACTSTVTCMADQPADAPYPARPIRFVNGAAVGTVMDIAARQIAEKMALSLGQPVIVEPHPSAGGIAALDALRRSPPDGYAISLVHFGQMSVAPSLFDHLPYDTVNDFAPLGIIFRGPQVLVVHRALPVSTLEQFIVLARTHPDGLRYSSPGNGTPTQIFMERFKLAAGINVQHIPYKGAAAHAAVIGGEVEVLLEGVAPLLPQIRAGRLRAIAVTGNQRLAVLPGVPTFEERGIHGMSSVWVGAVAPAGTPAPIVGRLSQELARAVESPDVRTSFENAGRVIAPGTPAAMQATIRSEIPVWRETIRQAQIVAE